MSCKLPQVDILKKTPDMPDLHIWRTKMNLYNCHMQLCKSILDLVYHISPEDSTFSTQLFIYLTWPRNRK